MPDMPTIGRIGLYRTDGRNGLEYDLPAIVTCTAETHPGDYPDGRANPLPVPAEGHVHLTVFTPGGFGTTVEPASGSTRPEGPEDDDFVGGSNLVPGSGTYVEWDVPVVEATDDPAHRTWRFPVRS